MNQNQKILTVAGIGVGAYLLYIFNRKVKSNKKLPARAMQVTPANDLTDKGTAFIGEPMATIIGVRSPSDVTWQDFQTLISHNANTLSSLTTMDMLHEQQRANNFLVNVGWDGVYNHYRSYLPNEILNNEVAFSLNINGGFTLSSSIKTSPFAPSVPTFSPAPSATMCTTTGAVTTGTQPLNVTTVPAVLADVAWLTCSVTPASPAVPVCNTASFTGGTRNNRRVALS